MPNISQQLPQQLSFEFNLSSVPIHIEMINNEPWFLAKDVCDILGLQNPSARIKERLDEDEYLTYVVRRSDQSREMLFVNESGLYNLIFQSNKPEAKKFRKWVTNEVLPSIRKTGSYGKQQITYRQIEELLPYADSVQYEGETLYAAKQLLVLLGKTVHTSTNAKLQALHEKNLAHKLAGGGSGMTKWYIKRKGIGELLRVRANTIARIQLIKQLKEGGML